MLTSPLSFSAFQQTGRPVADLRDAVPVLLPKADYPEPVPGRLYEGDLYIEAENSVDSASPWTVQIGSQPYTGDRATCEAELYGYYASEFVRDPDLLAYLVDDAPASSYFGGKPDDSFEVLCAIYRGYSSAHGLSLGCVEDALCEGVDHKGHLLTESHMGWLRSYNDRWEAWERSENDRHLQSGTSHPTQPQSQRMPAGTEEPQATLASRAVQPSRPNGFTDAEWNLVLHGWDLHAALVG